MPETRYASAPDGVKIAYQVTGEGGLDLVLMQGAVAHLELAWEDARLSRLFDRLGAFSRLIRFDRRGMGMSDPLDQLPTFDEQIEDFGAVMDAVGSCRAHVHDRRGHALARVAAEHPDRTTAVIAFETPIRFMGSDDDDLGVDVEVLGRMGEAIRAFDMDAWLSIVAPSRKDEPGFQTWWRRYTRSASSGFQLPAFMALTMTWDITDRLSEIHAPVLVLHKTEQAILPIHNAQALTAALPDARLVELPGTGTMIVSGDVDDIADEIQAFLTGTRPPSLHDRVLSTVLFTDIVGSTQRAAAIGDREWRDLLEHHNRLLRSALERFGGHEVHTAGDGFLATFDSPRRAIECARAAGEAVRTIGLEIRAGVHTGEIELSGGDVQGIAVHIGARIAALADAGDVFVSSTVKDLVSGSGIEFDDRGAHELKGVPGDWRVFSVKSRTLS